LTRKSGKTVYFTKGHGEKNLEGYEGDGLDALKKALEQEQYRAQELVLLQEGIPEGCSLLVIAGPQADFLESETSEVEKYLRSGGRVLLLIDPGRLPNLVSLAARCGITVGQDVVVDLQSRRFLGDALSPLILDYHQGFTGSLNLFAHSFGGTSEQSSFRDKCSVPG
ncbi:MAG TPA: Gldg family protein, partial [bacterium]|nr:Gldg family protein [bacterium]